MLPALRADIDLEGDTRWVAAWLMAGRTLSLAFSLALLVRSVNVAGAVLVARTMHEANRLLGVFLDREETTLVARWLADESIELRETRVAMGRALERDRACLLDVGVELDAWRPLVGPNRWSKPCPERSPRLCKSSPK